ncbi:MAG: hypothetical protein Fur0021_25130 [Candidatus Promineifilaceae bacterium]
MIRAVKTNKAQVFNGPRQALPAEPGETVLTFEHDGDFYLGHEHLSDAGVCNMPPTQNKTPIQGDGRPGF